MENRVLTAHVGGAGSGSQGEATLQGFSAARRSIKERLAAGKALRDRVPRASHADYNSPAGVF
ncbi:MAG: hypothetical protein C0484_04325 [Rhodospirillum sp.]|nr:hypothetical protein [Rhodospirillum sp.]